MAIEETIRRREYHRKRRETHGEELRECSRQWYYAHRQQVLSKHRERMATDFAYVEKIRETARRSYAKRRDAALLKQQRREYYAKNREHIRMMQNRWVDDNREKVRAKNRTCTGRWFAKHKREVNERLRQQYANDPELRRRHQERHGQTRAKLSAGHIPEPKKLYRTVQGNSVRVFRKSEVARMVGCAAMTVTNWEREGWIPKPPTGDAYAPYTIDQVNLMRDFYSVSKHDHNELSAVSKIIFDNWQK